MNLQKKRQLISFTTILLAAPIFAEPNDSYPNLGQRVYIHQPSEPIGAPLNIKKDQHTQAAETSSVTTYRDPDVSEALQKGDHSALTAKRPDPKKKPPEYKKSIFKAGSIPIYGKYREPRLPFQKPPIILDGPNIQPLN